jgi:hypothetical protein
MNRKAQGVFLAAILGLAGIIAFILALPILMDFLGYGISQVDQPFTILLIGIIPVFIFVMLIWGILAMARNQ